jgi:hypothetical protein
MQRLFKEFIQEIQPHLYASDSYELRELATDDKYLLLPAFWQAMSPEQKRRAVEIVNSHDGNAWGVDCCLQLSQELSVRSHQRPASSAAIYFCAIEDPTHLNRGLEEDAPSQSELPPEVAEAEAACNDATAGLSLYHRIPPGMKGVQLLDHMTKFSQRTHEGNESDYGISSYSTLPAQNLTLHIKRFCSMNTKMLWVD